MTKPKLIAAFGDYDRVHPLISGMIGVEGVDLRCLTLEPPVMFNRMCSSLEFDLSEMSMGSHLFLAQTGDSPFVGVPAFLSRAFRHSNVYVNVHSGIERPEDLNGKKIAIREWGMTALIWIVGILSEEYGFDVGSVDWVGMSKPRVPIQMPPGMKIRYMGEGETISQLIESGSVDAALIHQVPQCYVAGSPNVKRLFNDFKAAEIRYFQRTGIFPIMHCVVIRKDVCSRYPWLAPKLYEALCRAKEIAIGKLSNHLAFCTSIPFLPSAIEETREIFGEDFWPYGIETNLNALEKLLLYSYQQNITTRKLRAEELFCDNFCKRVF